MLTLSVIVVIAPPSYIPLQPDNDIIVFKMTMMNSNYLIFVDESGDHHLNKYPKDFPMFVLAFVIITKDEYCDHLLPMFSRLKLKYFPDVSTIFHEREIRKAEKRFNFLTNYEMRKSFYIVSVYKLGKK
jgi:hypothetical protein